MATEALQHKLAAIFYADVAGYSRLTGEDEEGTHRRLSAYLDAVSRSIEAHNGRIVHYAGDAVLADFSTVSAALSCAVDIQRELKTYNQDLPQERRVEFRIGVNLGEVIVDRDDIYGNGVNVAARLESLGDPGGICISGAVYDAIGNTLPLHYEFMGEQQVKNIAKPVHAYRVLLEADASYPVTSAVRQASRKSWQRWILMVTVAAMLVGGVLWSYFPSHQLSLTVDNKEPLPKVPSQPSIAVLPFVNLSEDSKQEFFADGMTDDLITDLAKLSGLFVIARNSVFTYKGRAVKVTQIAEELGVRYVLEGSVRRAEDRVRINVQLIDALSGRSIWAERYDRMLDDVFALQDEVQQQIISALAVQLSTGEQAQLARQPTSDIKAYEYYLRGLQAMERHTIHGTILAYAAFNRAIEYDPNFAEAHAALALNYAADYEGQDTSVLEGWQRPPEKTRAYALESATKALLLNSDLAVPYMVFARLQWSDGNYEEAYRHIAKAISLAPNDSRAFYTQALILTSGGDHPKALDAIRKALSLDPKPPTSFYYVLGRIHFALRNYSTAVENLVKARGSLQSNGVGRNKFAKWFLAASYAYLDQTDEAKSILSELVEKTGWSKDHNLTAVRLLSNAYRNQSDMDHYLRGLRKAGLPELPFGFQPAEHEAQRLRGTKLEGLLAGGNFTAFRRAGTRTMYIRIERNRQSVWQVRHDIVDTSPVWIEDDQVCFQLANYFKNHRLCFMVFENKATVQDPEYPQYSYRLIGPAHFFLSPDE